MPNDYDEQRSDILKGQLNSLLEEENHYTRLSRVFGTDEGIEIFEWLLELCGYWKSTVAEERQLGKHELGRFIFNQLCVANMNLVVRVLQRRKAESDKVRADERKKVEDQLKNG